MRATITVVSVSAILLVLLFAAILIPDVLRGSLTLLLHAFSWGFVALLVVLLSYTILNGLERLMLRHAERHKVEHEADVMTITAPADHRTYLRERRTGIVRNLTMDSRLIIPSGNSASPSDGEQRTWLAYHQLNQPARVVGAQALPQPEPQPIDIMMALRRTPRALVVGNTDAGKSTVLLWLAEQMIHQGKVVIIDPHSFPDKWPDGCAVIGAGSRHDLIEKALDQLVAIMVDRYKQIGRGEVMECGHPCITVIVDEWMSIAEQCRNARGTLIRLLTESRKAAFYVYVGSHSDRVRSLGLDGRGDLRQGFEIYHLDKDKQNGQHRAWLELDGEETPLLLPGPYQQTSPLVADDDLQALRALDVPPDTPMQPGPEEAQVIEMFQAGDSLRAITQAVFGDGKYGDHWNRKVYDILDRYGVSR